MNQYAYRIEPTRPEMPDAPTEHEAAIVSQHYYYLKGLTEAGVVLHAGRTPEVLAGSAAGFGLVVFMAADDVAAAAIMNDDPAVQQAVMQATLYRYRTALGHPMLGAQETETETVRGNGK